MCRNAGHGDNSAVLALDMSLPAATQLRQHALGLHLRRALPGACASTGAGARSGAGASDALWAPGGFVTDLKTAVRLALGGALAAALGAQLASDAPVRKGLQVGFSTVSSVSGNWRWAARWPLRLAPSSHLTHRCAKGLR